MKIKNLKVRTRDETIKLSNIRAIMFGEIYRDKKDVFSSLDSENLYVEADRGTFSFPLNEITSIEFLLDNGKKKIRLVSYFINEEEQ